MTSAVHVLIPGDLEIRTGGYGYDRRIIAGLRNLGWRVDVRRLDDSFPTPTPAARAHAAKVLADIPDGAVVLVDGLALGALPAEAGHAAGRLKIVALVHHPLAEETGIDTALAAELRISETHALAAVRAVVVTSRTTAVKLREYGVTADRITVVEPGTDPAPLARGSIIANAPSALSPEPSALSPKPLALSPEPADVALLCVATLTPRKGYELLMSALAATLARNWHLTCAGSLERDDQTVSRVRAQVRDNGLEDRVSFVGDLDAAAVAVQYDRADVFVLPTLYEGYGMVVAEALARGLPIVSTATGAIHDLVGTDAGIVVAPGDLPAFTEALSRVLGDADLRARLAAGARETRQRLPTWDQSAASMARVLEAAARA
ncbi:MAG TPA: glycosyltransferase family 4 protein [Vicinamibacterales bacterium]|nr:glycosyltransferase family 4 protein [Vicinamibacterales bacterium]